MAQHTSMNRNDYARGAFQMTPFRICLLAAAAIALSACSKSEPEATAAAAEKSAAAPKPATTAPADPTAKMARAVGGGKPGAAVDLRYEIGAKPSVGTSTQVSIALVPSVGVDAMEATITGMDGITISGDLAPKFEKVEAGKPYTHSFSLLPDRAGVFYVTVVVNTQIGGSSISRTFSIPFVVGTVAQAEKPQPQKDASGQAVQPMKAQEPKN